MQRENTHLLVIEDNDRYLKELQEWLDEFGYQNITTAISAKDAEEKLENPCDVIVADMRMERDDSGFTILEYVKQKNLSAVVIILTANDTVADCRRAFRENAWDYISKNMKGDPFEALDYSIQDAITYFNRWGNRLNEQWIEENHETLEANYWGQWIAIINRNVIETTDTEDELLKRLEERKLPRFTTTIKKIGELPPIGELISRGESGRLEFKSTLQWNIYKNEKDKKLQQSCLKTIVAFLNSEGGDLLIGVEDNGNILGLEKDFKCFNNPSLDKFERQFFDLIETYIGKRFLHYIKCRFENIDGQDVCGIHVRNADRKAFLKVDRGIEFYVRTGNSSRNFTVPEIYDHL